MNYAENFRKNLSEIRRAMGLTMEEYSRELCTPKSTLQAVMKTGQTTLETACTIARNLRIPLSVLTGGQLSADKMQIIRALLLSMQCFADLPAEKRENVARCVQYILEAFQNEIFDAPGR